jgi:nucleotide-binding universal stress UspA family protein
MYRKLLVACDGSEGSQIAVLHASILAKKLGAELSALWVRGSLPHYPETIDEIDVEEESAHEFFENIKAQLQSVGAGLGVTIRPEMRTGHPAQQILEFARAHDTDLIVIGSRGHSRLWGELIGHTADRVNEHAPCSVLIVRSVQEAACYRKTLVAYDGSDAADTALRHALAVAKHIGSEAHLLATVVIPASGANCLAALPTALAIWRAVTFSLFEKRRDYKIFGDSCRLKSVPM